MQIVLKTVSVLVSECGLLFTVETVGQIVLFSDHILEGSGGEACHFCYLCEKQQKRSFRFVCSETKKLCLL